MKYPWYLLLLLGCSAAAAAADDIKLVVGSGNSGICMADQGKARGFATLDAKADAYERCNDFGKDWNLRDEWQLPAGESKGNPRDVVQCTACKTADAKPADGFKCTVRMLPQSCVKPAAGQSPDRYASNADWDARDRTSAPAKPETAAACVQVGTGGNTMFLKNMCGKKIVVFWCHKDGSSNRDLSCGAGEDRHYKLVTVLAAGQADNNPPPSHPLNVILDYGACYGDIGDFKYTDNKGGYRCQPPAAAAGQTAATTITANATSINESCMRGRLLAMNHGTPSECACQIRGPANICRVQYSGPTPPSSAINNLKNQLGDFVKKFPCAPSDSYCIKSRNVGTGVRG